MKHTDISADIVSGTFRSRSGGFVIMFVIFLILPAAFLFSSCHEYDDYPDDVYGNFDALVKIVGDRYCFFEEKDLDWKSLSAEYRDKLDPGMRDLEFFNICAALLDELKDGHVNLVSRFNTSYYRQWWSDYPQDFNLRTLQEYYLRFDYMQTSGISYKVLNDSIGYMYCPSFSSPISETGLDYILAYLYKCKGLIIDIRNNGGGLLTNVPTLVGRFIDRKVLGGYIRHKTGPGENEFSKPYPIEYEPCAEGRIKWEKPIVVLTNRSSFSAANDFASVMKSLPGVRLIGARTGGGGGLPFSSELPNGWSVRFSACPISNEKDENIEHGVEPSEGCELHATSEQLAAGVDPILDFAINYLTEKK